MRIVAGKYRHRLIDYPEIESTRPTMDKVREALMSALGNEIAGRVVLDLFAGSGALGIESLSRGAEKCYFVDNNQTAVNVIKNNIKKLSVSEETFIYKLSYKDFLDNNQDKKFSLVFLDPPYKQKEAYSIIVEYLLSKEMLSEDAIIVMESDYEMTQDLNFKKFKHYKYGIVHVNIFWR